MNKSLICQLDSYYKEITDYLICSKKEKSSFIKELKTDIDEFILSFPEAAYEDIISTFGTPREIADSFISLAKTEDIRKRLDIRKLITGLLLAAFIIYLLFIIISLIDVHTESHGYFEEGFLFIQKIVTGGGVL